MVENKPIKKIKKLLQTRVVQRSGVLAVAVLVVGSVAFFGTHQNQGSHAAGVGTLSMSPATSTLTVGTNVTVTLNADSGTDPVNAVQASVTYDSTKLQYVSMTEGTAFPTIAATSTSTPGVIRVGRATLPGSPVTGNNTVVKLTFTVLGNSGTTNLAYDTAFSYLVRSTDSVNILSLANGATYTLKQPAPTLTNAPSPASGPTAGGNTVKLYGTNFRTGLTATFGGTPATNVIVTDSGNATVTAPAHAAGAVNVVVANSDGQSATKTLAYTYIAPTPSISSVTPVSGLTTGGTRITIAGTNFALGATVKVGGTAATSVVFVSATSLTAVVPAHAAGVVAVVVTNPDGQSVSRASAFTYVNPAPTITGVNPTTSPIGGGVTVTVTGTNFMSGATVTFGPTQAASVTFVSSTSLQVVTPVGTAGTKEIIVTNPDGQSTGGTPPIFTYLSDPGDANSDGRVNAIDLSMLISHDGQNYPEADFNGDGTVGSADLAILLGKWTW